MKNQSFSANSQQAVEDKDLFMICFEVNQSALSELPPDYHFRNCQEDELDIWKKIHFDTPDMANQHFDDMSDYYSRVYAPKDDLFFEKCLFAFDQDNAPVGTAFIWKAYDTFNSIHWFKVIKHYEGKGIGRALLSTLTAELSSKDFPLYLHTHPASFRAIKLYSDFGFQFLTNPIIGRRKNDLTMALPYLEKMMPTQAFSALRFIEVPQSFIRFMNLQAGEEF
ncbi:MAG: GNAT family N-acetyltransferase [Trueperaceae bacterium]|nr:GNAT family N-acetyltransferase [Trueperaceae bacterium]